MTRHLRVIGVQVRASLATAMQYRVNFLIQGGMALLWVIGSLIPLWVLFAERPTVAGWSFEGALVVMGWFTLLRGVLEGAINPSLVDIVDRVRTGSFDYLLLKPVDSQLLVSTARFEPWKIVDVFAGIGLMSYAFVAMGRSPSAGDIALAGLLLGAAILVLYSLWIVIVSASFVVVRIDNLTYLFSAIFDAGRWPVQVFRGFWRVLFTVVIPLAVMTTYPAMALLGTLEPAIALAAVGGAALVATVARALWVRSVSRYTSASS